MLKSRNICKSSVRTIKCPARGIPLQSHRVPASANRQMTRTMQQTINTRMRCESEPRFVPFGSFRSVKRIWRTNNGATPMRCVCCTATEGAAAAGDQWMYSSRSNLLYLGYCRCRQKRCYTFALFMENSLGVRLFCAVSDDKHWNTSHGSYLFEFWVLNVPFSEV